MNRQRKLLFALVGGLALALAYAWFGMPRQQQIDPSDPLPVKAAGTRQKSSRSAADHLLRVDLLEPVKQSYSSPKRDLFHFVAPPAPKPKPVVVVPKPVPVPVPVVDPEEIRQTEVRQALARFTFLGFLLKDQRRTVFLSQGETLFLVQEGEHFGEKDRFHAVSITPEKMMIRQADADGTIDIQLIEKEPLTPSFAPRATPAVRSPGALPVVVSPPASALPTRSPLPFARGARGSRWAPSAPVVGDTPTPVDGDTPTPVDGDTPTPVDGDTPTPADPVEDPVPNN